MTTREKNLINASFYNQRIDKMHGCVPEWATRLASEMFKITDEESRGIRDLVQENRIVYG